MLLRQWTRQPSQRPDAERAGPLCRGLCLLWSGSNPMASSFGPASRSYGSPGTRASALGLSPNFAGSQAIQWGRSPVGSTPSEITLFSLASSDLPTTNDQGTTIGLTYDFASAELVRILQFTTGGWGMQSRDSSASNLLQVTSGVTPSATRHDFVVAVWRPNTGEKVIYVNGIRCNSSTTSTGEINRFNQCEIGLRGAINSQAWDGSIVMAGIYNRALTDAEVVALSANPWQLFAPRRIWVPQSAITGLPTITALTPTSISSTTALQRFSRA